METAPDHPSGGTGGFRTPLLLLAAVACSGGRADGGRAPEREDPGISVRDGQGFDDVFVVLDTVLLEESATVVTVSPRVSPDPLGGFIVADPAERQVRFYSPEGKLKEVIGAGTGRERGISSPQRARRLPSGDILIANLQGSLTRIADGAHAAPVPIPHSLRTLRDFESLSENEILLAGTDSAPPSATLFILDLAGQRITRQFFSPPAHLDPWVTAYFSGVRIARWNDRVVAVHMLSDSLTFFDLSGAEVARLGIPIAPFVVPVGPLPDLATERERQAWSSQFTIVSDVWWIADDQLIVQWHKPRLDHGMEWGVLRMDPNGGRAWAIAPAPHLYAISGDRFVFRDPRAEGPNRWLVAKQRL